MLPGQELPKIEELDLSELHRILDKHAGDRGALIPILQDAQNAYGYLRPVLLQEISRATGVPLSRIYGVVTFYAQFHLKPRGRNIIHVCRGTACHVKGARRVRETVERTLGVRAGETTPDMRFTMETVACLGTCFLAPVVLVNQTYYGKLSPKRVPTILQQYE